MSFDEEIDERRRALALFRHDVLAELRGEKLQRGELSLGMMELASKLFHPPGGKPRRFSLRTLWSWWSAYRREGLRGLLPQTRSDKGVPRRLSPELLEEAIKARREIPSRSTPTLIDLLARKHRGAKLARSTLDRHLERAGASRRRLKTLGDKRYIRLLFERPNQFWIGDYHEANILFEPTTERFRTVHLSAFLDHYSKLVPQGQWYPNERIATLEDTLKKSILKRGLPEKIYVDWGSVYRSSDFAFALDLLDIRLVHSKAYTSEGRGGIERWNRTVVEQFEPEARALRIVELSRLNLLFEAWLEERYHREVHDATGETPLDRFSKEGFTPRWADPLLLQDTFRVRVRRKVHPKTSTVDIDGIPFLVESFLRGRWVYVHYDPHQLQDVVIFFLGKRVQRAFPQKPNEPPQLRPERPTASPPTFDYLAALRADYDRRITLEAKKLTLAEWAPTETFSLPPFLALCAQMLGKSLAPYERDELTLAFHTVGPFSETTTRLALEHALKLRGRGLHVSVYSHYLKVFHLSALGVLKEKP